MSERSLAGTHGQSGVALTLSAVRSGGHSLHSQADSAGSIPVTRSTREKRCSTIELEDSSFLLIRVFGPCSGHYGPHISTVQDSSFSFTRRSAYSVMFSASSVPRSPNVTRECLRKYELDVNGLNYNAAKNRHQ